MRRLSGGRTHSGGQRPRLIHVRAHLSDERILGVEHLLPAQPVGEAHLHLFAVEVEVVSIDHVRLDAPLHTAVLGVLPYRDGCRHPRTRPDDHPDPAGIHAIGRYGPIGRHFDVRGGNPEGATAVVAMHYLTSVGERSTQDQRHLGEITIRECLAHAGGGETVTVATHLQSMHGETHFVSELAHRGDIPTRPVTEPKVLPHHHCLGFGSIDDELLHEFPWTHSAQLSRERNDDDVIHARILQGIYALIQSDQHRGSIVREQHPSGVRVEGDGNNFAVAGQCPRLSNDRLMPSVHDIEDSDDGYSLAHGPEAYACVLALVV